MIIEGGTARMGGVDLGALARERGTPVFVYDGDAIGARAWMLAGALGDRFDVHASIKANPAIGVCALWRREGLGAEIASSGELVAALASGFAPGRILFAGPGKTDDELAHAVRERVGQINAESVGEVERIAAIARAMGVVQRVGVRVNLRGEGERGGARIATSGGAQKFGIDEDGFDDAVGRVMEEAVLELGGIHAMLGSQVLEESVMLAHADRVIGFAEGVARRTGAPIRSINLGGGIGVSHTGDRAGFDLERFARALRRLVEQRCSGGVLGETHFAIEPGRVLCSDLGVYLTRVVDVKDSGAERVVIVDGGIHHALLPITANTYEMVNVDRLGEDGARAIVGGPLCTSVDQWRPSAPMGSARVGDVVAMLNAGAYGLSAGMTMFLSRGVAEEVLVLGGAAHVIRARSVPEDVLRGQSIPEGLGS
jgi:diaminopimelate decarboxylase